MAAKVLAILVAIYAVDALVTFGFLFVLSHRGRRKALDREAAGEQHVRAPWVH
ncbi:MULTISPECIES: hypothetical protein [unclassified Mesorhizobium]|uniref:hypothetical protein n=1 Tax=unclassified Mesorhizobium TaxID=325217 RepID=UPI0015CA79AF|nr:MULTISPECIES: hypothetical protein [unclassified Mesorhizobium]